MEIKCSNCGEPVKLKSGEVTECKCGAEYSYGEHLPEKEHPELEFVLKKLGYTMGILFVVGIFLSLCNWLR